MENLHLASKIQLLPDYLKEKVEDFVDSLMKENDVTGYAGKPSGFGVLKGRIKMSPDFDDPLEDFADYE